MGGQTDKQAGRQTDRQGDRQAGRQGDGQAEGRTDMTKLKVAFRNFVKEPKTTPLAASVEAQSF